MRNFYLKGNVDGRKTNLEGGPQSKDGGMYVSILQRDNGNSIVACNIKCYVTDNHNLMTEVIDSQGKIIFEFETKR